VMMFCALYFRRSPTLGARCGVLAPTVRRYGAANILHEQNIPRASINNLWQLTHNKSSTSYFPPQLLSLINESAKEESQSNMSDKLYNDLTREMTSFMLQSTNSQNDARDDDRMTSEQVYNPGLLDTCDALVWGFNSPFLWRITQEDVKSLYKSNISKHHCEIAVGTGLFLSKDVSNVCKTITLIDLNENSLQSCEKRIQSTYLNCGKGVDNDNTPVISKLVADIMVPPEEDSSLSPLKGKFQSVGANFLFHCLHGSNFPDKAIAFRNCASLLDPQDGVFFGSTILGKEMLHDKMNAGKTVMQVLHNFNESGVFGNLGDLMEDLECLLEEIFADVEVWRVGYCGMWAARNPK